MRPSSEFRESNRAQLGGRGAWIIPKVAIVLAVVIVVGREVVAQQRAALERCGPECGLLGYTSAAFETVAVTPVAITDVWAGPIPLGWVVFAVLCLFILRVAVTPPAP